LADVIIGAYGADPNGARSGASYVVFGTGATTQVELSNIQAGIGGFVINGGTYFGLSGNSVSGAGDINGDGLADVIVGVPLANPNGGFSGSSFLVFGKADTAAVELSSVRSGAGGFVINGAASADVSGFTVSGAGDVNGDGRGDLLVSARQADPNGAGSGASYVVFGKADTATVQLGSVGAGDVNGDGLADVIIGAHTNFH
jgi:hypothetical protein